VINAFNEGHAMAKGRKDQEQPDDDDRPWSEEKWEAFMKEGDLRAARFGEILETVIDDPDRDRIVARHMGWTHIEEMLDEKERVEAEGGGAADETGEDDDRDDDTDANFDAAESDAEGSSEDPFGDDEEARDERAIPAYKLANEVGMRVHEALQPFMQARAPKDPDEEWDRDEIDERMGEAYIGCMIAAAKVIGGHAMGYEDDVLCGNIANCKRGLAGADQCEQALLWLRENGALPAELVDRLLPDVRAVQQAVRARIEELRQRVWW
jgi:hypothetical protein